MRNTLVTYLDQNNLFNTTQHAFRKGRSCLSQLLAHYDEILSLIENGLNVDVVYLDFAKAFDKVDIKKVLYKMKCLGVEGKLYNWIESFLLNRTQTVVVEGYSSTSIPVKSGVPQGSVLGPLIFIILMTDIDEELMYSLLKSFADDTRVMKGVSNVREASQLQGDLFNVYDWAESNNMEFNSLKFEILRYGADEALKQLTNYLTNIGTIIDEKDSVKDLGIIMSNDGSFTEHVNHVVDKAKTQMSSILRNFKSRSLNHMLCLWKSIVIPT